MHRPLIATALEQEYLQRSIESGLDVRSRAQFFLWTQGPLQALLPHDILVCLQFGPADEVVHTECLHSGVPDTGLLAALQRPVDGLGLLLAGACADAGRLPHWLHADATVGDMPQALATLAPRLRQLQLDHALLHGTGPVSGGASFFALFGRSRPRTPRAAGFLALLLPFLHLAWLRVCHAAANVSAIPHGGAAAITTTAREEQVLHWVRQGKTNFEIGQLLGISALTVKSHLQKIFRKLQVHNRAQAVSFRGGGQQR